MRPDVFLLDESTPGIDEGTPERINPLLNRFSTSYMLISQDRGVLNRTTQSMYKMAIGRLEIITGS